MKLHDGETTEVEVQRYELLRDEVHRLECRVDALEHGLPVNAEPAPQPAGIPATTGPAFALPNAIPVAGRAILGLAGAYLLRALAESDAVPRLLVVLTAILYAASWLVFAVRTRQGKALAGATYAATAALILAPLLWEATVRFGVLQPPVTAAILVAFVALSSGLAWQGNAGTVSSITILAAVLTALALMVRTGDLVPFAVALLSVACTVEAGICLGHRTSIRLPVALAADFAIWLPVYIMTSHGGVPQDYRPVGTAALLALCAVLFLIYAGSVAWRNVVAGLPIGIFEIGQTMAAFLLAAGGALLLGGGRAAAPVGAFAALACAACYFTAFLRFAESPRRNHYVFAWWGLALGLLACWLILPEIQLTLIWSAAAIVATLVGARAFQPVLSVHGAVFLLAAALLSDLPASMLHAFTGATLVPVPPGLWIVATSALCCYAIGFPGARAGARAEVSLVPALVAALAAGALLILGIVPLFGGHPSASLLATSRTLVTCLLALAFGVTGSRTEHRELIWISYAALALGTVKLLLEDFRQSHPAALALSLICYGALLLAVPKWRVRAPSDSH